MAILPISGVRVNNTNRTSFTSLGMGEAETIDHPDSHKPRKTNKLASVPVALLIAMSPAMMNGNEPVKAVPLDNDQLTELLAYAAPSELEAPEPQISNTQANYPFGLQYLSNKKIFAKTPIVSANGESATLVYSGKKDWHGQPNINHVQFIYYIPKNHNIPTNSVYLPEVVALVYHDIGKDKEFVGIEVEFPEVKNGTLAGYTRKEIKINDDDANDIGSFMANEKEYKNNIVNLKYKETKSATLMKPERYGF